ncbi:LacI family DNA-binding transcriptional regulator [Brachybacterium sp. AOP25-B2-12]|uniref:LacI family DNA-binding transcriptional regulator n=1 Tax=Brachybacterium sp. AOP25-B2-12 TaxID=3457710 RepID=UPI0040345BAD
MSLDRQPTTTARRRVTRQDVARLAGVSVPVVTYALNGGPKNVSPATRDKVLAAVDQLGYRPNAAARALRRGRSELLGIIVPNLANPLFAALAHEVEVAAGSRGVTLIVLSASPGEVAAGLERLAARQVDGVLVATPVRSGDIAAIEVTGLPTVLINQPGAIEGIPAIGVDQYGGARLAVDHLVAQGHRDIAYLGPASGDQRRHEGWRDAMGAAGLAPVRVVETPFTREGGYLAGRTVLASTPRPSAVFASSDQIALGALRAFHEAAIDVPGDIAVASFDDSPDAAYAWPPLSSVSQPIGRMAREAVGRLLDGVPADGTPFQQFPVELVVRRSSVREP